MNRLLTLALPLLLIAGACSKRETPEEQIQKMLDEGVELLEKGDVAGAGDLLSDDYMDSGKRDKKMLKRIAFFYLRAQKASFFLRETQITMSDDLKSAEVATNVIVGARAADVEKLTDRLPSGVRKLPITMRVVKEGDDWRIAGIEGDGLKGGMD
jgi:hypothetical protein